MSLASELNVYPLIYVCSIEKPLQLKGDEKCCTNNNASNLQYTKNVHVFSEFDRNEAGMQYGMQYQLINNKPFSEEKKSYSLVLEYEKYKCVFNIKISKHLDNEYSCEYYECALTTDDGYSGDIVLGKDVHDSDIHNGKFQLLLPKTKEVYMKLKIQYNSNDVHALTITPIMYTPDLCDKTLFPKDQIKDQLNDMKKQFDNLSSQLNIHIIIIYILFLISFLIHILR